MTRLELGRIVATPSAVALLADYGATRMCTVADVVSALLTRHASGDWGVVDADEAAANDRAVQAGAQVLSCYLLGERTIFVITEADRSVTMLLLPEEY